MAQRWKNQDDEAVRTAEALRLVTAFAALDNRQLREALIVLAEHLAAVERRRS